MAVGHPHVADHELFQVRNLGALEPVPVGHEGRQRYRKPVIGVVPASGFTERPQGVDRLRVGQVGRESRRREEHAAGHRRTPQLHRQPELAERHPGGAQVGTE